MATFGSYKSWKHQVLNCLIFQSYMKSICLWAKKITIEEVITLLQVLSSSFIFPAFTKCQTVPLRLTPDPNMLSHLEFEEYSKS